MSKNSQNLNWPFPFATYPGGKGGDCVYQSIINMMPAHENFVSLFLGGGFVENYKRLANRNLFIEADKEVFDIWSNAINGGRISPSLVELLNVDCHDFLKVFRYDTSLNHPQTLIFADPPYLAEVRSDKRKTYYKHELKSRAQHARFLLHIANPLIKAKVMICGYQSSLYDFILIDKLDWQSTTYMGRTRGGMREETIWMNFDPLDYDLHEYTYVGENARERHRIKKKVNREIKKLARLPQREREAILTAIREHY